MTAQADKVVVFRLAVEVDPRAEQEARRFSERLGALDKARHESARSTAERASREQQRIRERDEREKLAAFDREMRAADKLAKAEADFEAKADRERQKRWAAQDRAQQQAVRSFEQGQDKMREASYRAMEGIAKIGEGMVKLGILNKETTEDILRAYIAVRGAFEVIRGGIEIWRALTEAARAYRTVVASLAAVELGAGAAAVGGGALGTAGKVGLGAAALAGAKWLLPKAGFAAAAAAGGLGIHEAAFAAAGREGFVSSYRGWRDAAAELASGNQRTARMFAELESGGQEWMVRRALVEAEGQSAIAAAARRRNQLSVRQSLLGGGASESQAELMLAREDFWSLGRSSHAAWVGLAGAQGRYREGMARGGTAEFLGGLAAELKKAEAIAAATDHALLAAADRRLAAERAINAEKIAGADAAIAKARQEISVREGAVKAAQSAILSAEERFGLMDPTKQRRLLGVLQKGREGGRLSNQEIELLREFGTTEAQAMVREEGRTRARRALGTEDEERIRGTLTPWEAHAVEREFREMAKVQTTINQQLDVKVELKHDIDRIVNEILSQVKSANDREMERVRKEVAERIQRLYDEQQRAAVQRQSAIPKRP